MALEIDEVQAWLLELHQVEAAALLSEAEFEYRWIDVAMPLDMSMEIDILELDIRIPPRIYRAIGTSLKNLADEVEAAISELSQHTTGSYIRSTTWLMKIPRLDEVASTPDVFELFSDSGFCDVQRLWTKAKARATNDPSGAITAARTMLESLCKILINEAGESFTNRDDLPTLYGKAVANLSLAPGQ